MIDLGGVFLAAQIVPDLLGQVRGVADRPALGQVGPCRMRLAQEDLAFLAVGIQAAVLAPHRHAAGGGGAQHPHAQNPYRELLTPSERPYPVTDPARVPAELAAALKLARKRKIGRFNPKPESDPLLRRKQQMREMGIMARGGFSYDIARQALDFNAYDVDGSFDEIT